MKKNKWILIIGIILIYILFLAFIFTITHVSPTIVLNGDTQIFVDRDSTYEEQGATAKFLFIDISNNIEIDNTLDTTKPGIYEISYKINNKFLKKDGKIIRTIIVKDDVLPTISLVGDAETNVVKNEEYLEAGYTAADNIDGDITDKVVVESNVDIATLGDYEIKYSVTDSSGNIAQVIRKVKVIEKPVSTSRIGSGLPVLMYHYFYDASQGETGENSNFMEIGNFEQQVKYLKESGYYFPTWDEVNRYLDGTLSLPTKSVVITADDSNESFFRLAYPVIKKYGVKATTFAIGIYINSDMVTAYSSEGLISFQSHTYNMHKGGCSENHGGYFNCVPYDEGLNDLKQEIELIKTTDAIAYPFGDLNSNIKQITKDAGIRMGFTTDYGKIYPFMDKLDLPRVRVNGGTSLESFKSMV